MWSKAHSAVEMEEVDVLRRLLAEGLDPNERDDSGMPLLHHAIDVERDGAAQTGTPLTVDITRLLIEGGADPRLVWRGESALDFARSQEHFLAVEVIEGRLAINGNG